MYRMSLKDTVYYHQLTQLQKDIIVPGPIMAIPIMSCICPSKEVGQNFGSEWTV